MNNKEITFETHFLILLLIVFLNCATAFSKVECDIDSNGHVGLSDSIYTLEVVAGIKSEIETNTDNSNGSRYYIAGETIDGLNYPKPLSISDINKILGQESEDNHQKIYGVYKFGQSFILNENINYISRISLLLKKIGNPNGTIELSIIPIPNNNTSAPLLKVSLDAERIAEKAWYNFDFNSSFTFNKGSYAITVSLPDGDSNNFISWFSSSRDIYAFGNLIYSDDYGLNWQNTLNSDFTFNLFGNIVVYQYDEKNENKTRFVGFGISNANKNENILVQTNGIVKGFKNLIPGKKYYLSSEIGEIQADQSFNKQLIGIAINTSEINMILTDNVNIASSDDAIIGVDDVKMMTPYKTHLAIIENAVSKASTDEAMNGIDDTKMMTPYKTQIAISENNFGCYPLNRQFFLSRVSGNTSTSQLDFPLNSTILSKLKRYKFYYFIVTGYYLSASEYKWGAETGILEGNFSLNGRQYNNEVYSDRIGDENLSNQGQYLNSFNLLNYDTSLPTVNNGCELDTCESYVKIKSIEKTNTGISILFEYKISNYGSGRAQMQFSGFAY